GMITAIKSETLHDTITSRKADPMASAISFKEITFLFQKLSANDFPSSLPIPRSTSSISVVLNRFLKKAIAVIIINIQNEIDIITDYLLNFFYMWSLKSLSKKSNSRDHH